MHRAVTLVAVLACVCVMASAQFGPHLDLEAAPQARTQQEFDAYLEVLSAKDDRQRVVQAEDFFSAYPESALQGLAAVYQMEAFKALDDFKGVLSSGERVLRLLPENLRALLTLASAIPNAAGDGTEDRALLDRAEAYAERALAVMGEKEIPRSIRLEDWKRFRAGMASEAHEALGHVAAKRGRIERAVSEFELAVRLNPSPEGRQFYRLGAAYVAVGRTADARRALNRAAVLGPDLIRQRATRELSTLGALGPRPARPAGAQDPVEPHPFREPELP